MELCRGGGGATRQKVDATIPLLSARDRDDETNMELCRSLLPQL